MKIKINLYSIKDLKDFEVTLFKEELDTKPMFDILEVHFDDSDEIYCYSFQENNGKFYIVTA